MALLGPMVVVAENSAADLIDVLRKAGAFPIVETRWADAPAAIEPLRRQRVGPRRFGRRGIAACADVCSFDD